MLHLPSSFVSNGFLSGAAASIISAWHWSQISDAAIPTAGGSNAPQLRHLFALRPPFFDVFRFGVPGATRPAFCKFRPFAGIVNEIAPPPSKCLPQRRHVWPAQ
jgi:hypothetical protein